jgi:hypothetical protein
MADNLSPTGADAALNAWGTNAQYIKLHIGAPGAAGTANPSTVTTRESVTWGSASGGVLTASNSPEWTNWAGTNGEDVTDISFWDSPTTGNFQGSMPLASGATMNTSDSLTLTPLSVTFPVAS